MPAGPGERYVSRMAGLLLAILLPLGLVLIGLTILFVWLRGRVRRSRAAMAEELRDETVVRGPEPAIYRGSTGAYSHVMGNGVIALTAGRLIFRKVVGAGVDVPVAAITGVTTSKSFNRAVVGGRTHLVVHTATGDVAFFVQDLDAWTTAVAGATGRR
jgi:hypothetical protein